MVPLRPSVADGITKEQCDIELYPHFATILLTDLTSCGQPRPFHQYFPVSRILPLSMLLKQLCQSLDIETKYGRLWIIGRQPNASSDDWDTDWLLQLDISLVEQLKRKGVNDYGNEQSISKIRILLELMDEKDKIWPRSQQQSTDDASEQKQDHKDGIGDGIVGLYNMGNTCYLNASIQCLSHTPVFRDYFTSKAYLRDINRTNPLGHQGRLAQVSAVLINSLWKNFGKATSGNLRQSPAAPGQYIPVNAPALTPKTFKDAMGKINDHFSGNEQHDAQELLAFLLSGLSEDLNRIVDKPYIEAPDSDGRPDEELAEIWWSNHLKREMSIIVSLFTGQYKSLLTCGTCNYESARFEPFGHLQIPLPEDEQATVQLVYFPIHNDSSAMKYLVRARHDETLFDLLFNFAKILYHDQVDQHQEKKLNNKEIEKEIIRNNLKHESDTSKISSESKEYHDNLNLVEEPVADCMEKKICEQMAHNMAAVKMGDRYIFNIIPVRLNESNTFAFLMKYFLTCGYFIILFVSV